MYKVPPAATWLWKPRRKPQIYFLPLSENHKFSPNPLRIFVECPFLSLSTTSTFFATKVTHQGFLRLWWFIQGICISVIRSNHIKSGADPID